MKMWTVLLRDQNARSVQSDLDLHCPPKILVSSTVRKDVILSDWTGLKFCHVKKKIEIYC